MRRIRTDVALDVRTGLGEGARWDVQREVLRFVDCSAPALHELRPTTGAHVRRALDERIAAFAEVPDGGLAGTASRGFVRLGETIEPLAPPCVDGVEEALNDGRCDARGRFWAGSSASGGRAGRGGLYRLDTAGEPPVRMLGGVSMGNGIGWSPDDATLYFVDSLRRRVDAFPFDLDAGTLGAPRPLVELPLDDGLPDGLAVDAEGCVWVAMWGPGEVRRYTPSGALDAVVDVAAANVTSCALTPHGLLITTAADHDERPLPHAGAVFAADVGVAGLPEHPFAGV